MQHQPQERYGMLAELLEKIISPAGVLLIVLTAISVHWLWSASGKNGPWGIPVLGYYPFLGRDYYRQLHDLSQKYGDVYLINIAGQNFVYLGSLRAIREAHVHQADYFSSRTKKHGVIQATLDNGLAYINGVQWRVLRKFFAQALRETGIVPKKVEQKGPMEDAIRETLQTLCDKQGEAVEILPLLTKQCTDVVLKLMLGEDITEEERTRLNEEYSRMLEPIFGLSLILIGDIARLFLLPRVRGYKQMLVSTENMKALLSQIVERHKQSFDFDAPPRDLVDMYLMERSLREKDPMARHFTDLALVCTLGQMYGDGSVLIAMFISSFCLTISRYPEVQDAIHEEIVRVVGLERLPTWEDRHDLPLTCSAMMEQLRINHHVFPIIPDMECSKDTTVLGVRVPKGYVTLMNIWAVNNNPETYENPEQFDPTRFLPEKKVDPPLTFGVGRRSCIGEGLVKTEMFLFVSAALQNFKISPAANGLEPETAFNDRLLFLPRPESRFAR